jgi:tetratricopeptide (TPR) repeat protein
MHYADIPEDLRDQLVAQFEERIAADPGSPWSDFFRSEIDLLCARADEAEGRLKDLAIHEDPMVRCHAFQALGQLKQADGKLDEAMTFYQRAALLEDRPGYSLIRQADIHLDRGEFEPAERIHLAVLASLESSDGVTALALAESMGRALAAQGRDAEALEAIKLLGARYPDLREFDALLEQYHGRHQ